MKDFIIKALTEANVILEKRVPKTKTETQYVDIGNVKPLDLVSFMKENNIPDNAEFGGRPNGYDAYEAVCLCWDIQVPTTEKEQMKYRIKSFETIAFPILFHLLTTNGYQRVGCNSGLFKEFDDTTKYDLFINNDIERLEKWYSLFFKKIEQ